MYTPSSVSAYMERAPAYTIRVKVLCIWVLVSIKMSDSNENVALFEGIIIGLYGNWLISLIDKISFTQPLRIGGLVIQWFQPFLFLVSILSLIGLLAIGIFGGRLETRIEVLVLSIFHVFPIGLSFYLEDLLLKDFFFLAIGGILFAIIYSTEYLKAKRPQKMSKEQ
jgi:hypothetical protein